MKGLNYFQRIFFLRCQNEMSKRQGRYRNWVFTLNFEDGNVVHPELSLTDHKIKFYAYQHEKVSTDHLQGVICFDNPRTLTGVKKILPRAHLEVMRGSFEQAYAYAVKQETRVAGPWEAGTPLRQGRRTDIEDVVEEIIEGNLTLEDCYLEYPAQIAKYPRYFERIAAIRLKRQARAKYEEIITGEIVKKVTVLYGDPGSGKTSAVYKKHRMEDIYTLTFGDGSSGSLWFDDYCGEKVLLLDDFYGQIRFATLLRILDIYPLRMQTKGGYTHVNFDKIYITSNSPPKEWYPNVEDDKKEALYRRIKKVKNVVVPVLPTTSVHNPLEDVRRVLEKLQKIDKQKFLDD